MTEFPATVPAAEPKPNGLARVVGALVAPTSTFESIARRPTWLAPALLILILGYIGTAIVLPRMDWDAVTAMQEEQIKKQNPNVSQEQIDRMARFTKAGGKVFGWVLPALGFVWYLIVALVLWLAFRLMGAEGRFSQAWAATLYAWMPLTLYTVILNVVVLLRGGLLDPTQVPTLVKSNPAFLVDMKANPLLFAFLGSFDIFTIWTVVLLIIGFAALARTSRGKAAAIVIPLWFVAIGLKLIGPAMQMLRR